MTTPKKEPHGANTPRTKRQLNVYINMESSAVLTAVLERDGVPYSAQIDRALRLWAIDKGIEVSHAITRKAG
jgi:hypothetical protein